MTTTAFNRTGVVSDQIQETDLATVAADLEIARSAAAEMADFVRTIARPWFEADGVAVGSEPTVAHEAGELAVELAAAEVLYQAALDASKQETSDYRVLLAQARGLASSVAFRAASFLFAAGGTSAADDPRDFGRHFRAAHASAANDAGREAFFAAGKAILAKHTIEHQPLTVADAAPKLIHSHAEALATAHGLAASFKLNSEIRDRQRADPRRELELYAQSGLLGITVPSTYGGLGISYADSIEISRIISSGDSSIGQISTIHYALVELLNRVGAASQRETWFPQVLAGARIGNAAAERGVAHAKITATRLSADPAGGYRLNGRKFYSTGAPHAALVVVLAVDDDGKPVSVLVPRDAVGLTILDDWHGLGQRATGSGTTILDNIGIPESDVLPRWLQSDQPNVGTSAANLAHVGIDLGIAEAALDDTLNVLRSGIPANDSLTLHRLGELSAKLEASKRLFWYAVARLKEIGDAELTEEATQTLSLQVSIAKVHAGEVALEIGQAAVLLAGPVALERGMDRHWRNARTHTLHDPHRWRFLRIGDFLLNGRLPPRNRSN